MRYGMEFLIRDIRANAPHMLQQLQDNPSEVAAQYQVDEDALKDIMNQDFVSLYGRGVHPLILMKLSVVLGIDLMEKYNK